MITKKILDSLEYQKVLEFIARYSSTEKGRELVLELIPSNDIDEIKDRGEYISEAKEVIIKKDLPPIEYIPNLSEALSKSGIEGAILTINDIHQILKLAEISRRVYSFLSTCEESKKINSDILPKLFLDKVFEHHLKTIFTESGEISDNASQQLKEIRKQIREQSDQLRRVINRLLKQLSESFLVQDEYVTQREGRFVLPVKAEHKRHVKGFIHSESATGQTVYIEPEETLELNNEILSLGFAEKREIERILKSITHKIGESSSELKKSLDAVSYLDLIFAAAKYSMEIIGSFPQINEENKFQLMNARHPILIKKLGSVNTVPLNFEIDQDNVILITGPNAGGKTVVLKTIGLLTLMVQSGLHIPAHPDSNFHFIEDVLIDIGDKQSIEEDLSTFSSHLSNIENIIRLASPKSIVLIDEIGTGTDPAEGSALAAAILIVLRDKKAKVLATTHHGNLKMIAHDLAGFQNASMEFDNENLKPTYNFRQGVPGSSYAFEIATRIGFENKVIELAMKYLDVDKTKVEDFLIELEKKSNKLKEQIDHYEIENSRLQGLNKMYDDKIKKLEARKKDILAESRMKADEYLADINKRVESAIKNIIESAGKKEIIKVEKQRIEEIKSEQKKLKHEIRSEDVIIDGDIIVGDYVRIGDTATEGTIHSLDKNKDKAVILSGALKIQAKYSELKKVKMNQRVESFNYSYDFSPLLKKYRLDLRGMKPDEAEFETVKFLDEAYSSSESRVEILHGKGTGVLKKVVHDILKSYKGVKNYYYANIEYGGEGITIVEFN